MQKLIVFVMFFFVVGITYTANAKIKIDGDASEWSTYKLIIDDSSGDYSPDFTSLKMTNDSLKLYILYSFNGPPPDDGCAYLLLDTDTNVNTGFHLTASNWDYDNFPNALSVAFGGNFIEASVQIDALENLSHKINAIDILAYNDRGKIGHYELKTVPLSSTIWLLGSGILGLMGIRRKI